MDFDSLDLVIKYAFCGYYKIQESKDSLGISEELWLNQVEATSIGPGSTEGSPRKQTFTKIAPE